MISRRAILFIPFLLSSCGFFKEKRFTKTSSTSEKMPDEYGFEVVFADRKNDFNIKVKKVKSTRHIETKDQYEEVYKMGIPKGVLNDSRPVRGPVDLAFRIIDQTIVILSQPFRLLLRDVPFTVKDDEKLVAEISRKERIERIENPDIDRIISITIKPPGDHIIVKTDKDGRAIFHMEMFVLEKEYQYASYSVEFAHNLISESVIRPVSGSTFEKAIRKKSRSTTSNNISPNQNYAAKGKVETVSFKATDRIRWFSEAENAAHLGEGLFTVRKLASLYREYGRTMLFIKHAIKVFAIDTIISYIVIDAFFRYAEYLLEKNGYTVE